MTFQDKLDTDGMMEALQAELLRGLPSLEHPNPEIARYRRLLADYPRRSGKLVRGNLTILSTLAHGGSYGQALPAATGIELFQSWVLIHDDIEDDSLIRRGSPALHRQVGMPVALNVGDGLHVHMWRQLIEADLPAAVLSEFLSTISRTAEGQHLDLAWVENGRLDVDEGEYLEMVRLKTAWYTVVTPLRLGALLLGLEPSADFTAAGLDLGAAFQIRDDVLNLTSVDTAAGGYGKEAAGDLVEAKRTLILAHFFASAPNEVADEARYRLLKPASERSSGDVDWLLAVIRQTGSTGYAQEQAEKLAASSLTVLQSVLAELPEQAAARAILDLLDTLAYRDR